MLPIHFWKFRRASMEIEVAFNELTRETRIAPVYDNGSCLYPQLTDKQMEKILETRSEIENRLYVFPITALKIDNKKLIIITF